MNLSNFFSPESKQDPEANPEEKKGLGPYSSNTRCLKRMRVPAQPLFQISTQEEGPHHPGAVPNQGPANHHPGVVPNQGPANHQPGAVPSQGPARHLPQGPATQEPATTLDQL